MRHGKTHNHLGRKTGHRRSMLRNLAISLITHKRISTTLAKAKALRVFVEPILTTSKDNTQHAHRETFRMLQNKEAVKELFAVVAPAVQDRPGGYCRVIRTGTRLGDNAETALIELVDFNETYNAVDKKTGSTRRRRRRSTGGAEATPAVAATPATSSVGEDNSDNFDDVTASAILSEAADTSNAAEFDDNLDALVGESDAVVVAPEAIDVTVETSPDEAAEETPVV